MHYIGKNINIKSSRTGKVVALDMVISRCFPSAFEYQQFLLNLYIKDFGVYQAYSQILLMYLFTNPNGLSEIEIVENKTILSTINAMYVVRDRTEFEAQQLAHLEMQEFIGSLTKKKT